MAHLPTPPSLSPPKQARSEETLSRLLKAAEALILEKGIGEVSVSEIVHGAHSSVGGFYARFRDKGELLRALEERFLVDISERLAALADAGRWGDAPLAEIVESWAAELVSVASERRNLIAAFLIRAAEDAALWADGLRFRRAAEEQIGRLLRVRTGEIRHPEPELAVQLAVQFALGLVIQRVLTGEVRAAGRALTDAELHGEIARNFLAYLGASHPRSTPS